MIFNCPYFHHFSVFPFHSFSINPFLHLVLCVLNWELPRTFAWSCKVLFINRTRSNPIYLVQMNCKKSVYRQRCAMEYFWWECNTRHYDTVVICIITSISPIAKHRQKHLTKSMQKYMQEIANGLNKSMLYCSFKWLFIYLLQSLSCCYLFIFDSFLPFFFAFIYALHVPLSEKWFSMIFLC